MDYSVSGHKVHGKNNITYFTCGLIVFVSFQNVHSSHLIKTKVT